MVEGVTWWLEILQQIFGNEIVGWVVLILSPFIFLYVLLWLIHAIIELVKTKFIPLFYNSNEKRKIRFRKRFADNIESEIRRLNQREDWNDFRFAELEAEVEMEGESRSFSFLPFVNRRSTGLRREKSLSKALKQSRERIVLVEGDPGSGKSVALRHVALNIAKLATKSKSLKSLIPVYVNLKELKREKNQPINRKLIEEFILKSLKRINDRDVDKFVDDEFYIGLENGSWFFLFDSFDEIPDILGAEDADKIIREYADAIYDFLHGLNACRGVVASRHFKGPGQVGWPRFKIMTLTKSRQIKLIKLSELKPHHEKILLGNLDSAASEIRKLAENPLFLGLLVGYVQTSEDFPQHVDAVFGAYIKHRINQDKDRVQKRFALDVEKIHLIAEKVAFCMSQSNDLGLSPTRGMIKKALYDLEIDSGDDLENSLEAMEFMKLARSDNSDTSGDNRVFTFSHRRFQEYFATLYVLREGKISVGELLRNPRWRETTVVICQTQPLTQISPLIESASALLASYVREIYPKIESMPGDDKYYPIDFPWPNGYLYLLDLLQDGFSNRKNLLPNEFQKSAGAILNFATIAGSLPSRIWALEVAGVTSSDTILEMIRLAIADKSHFLSDLAYRQVSRLDNIPYDVKSWIKQAVLKKLLRVGVLKGGNVVYAQVSRLVDAKNYISVIRGIQIGYWVDIVSSILLSCLLFVFAFVLPNGNESFSGVITWRIFYIFFGLFNLLLPFTLDSDGQNENFYFARISYIVLFLLLIVPVVLLFGSKSLYLLLLIYFYCVFPSTIAVIEEVPVHRGLLFVFLSPFFVLKKALKESRNLFASIKPASFSRRLIGAASIVALAALILCSVPIVSRVVFDSNLGENVVLTILMLGMLYMFYRVLSKTIFEDQKYRKAWRRWRSSPRSGMTVDEIINVLPMISSLYAYRLFEVIRENNLLTSSQENLYFIYQLIRLVENPFVENEFSEALFEFLKNVHENKLKSLLLDELFHLVEEMKYKLQ